MVGRDSVEPIFWRVPIEKAGKRAESVVAPVRAFRSPRHSVPVIGRGIRQP